MKIMRALSLEQANDILSKGKARRVELNFELTSDEFFRFAEYWCARGAKITKEENFIVKMKSLPVIPQSD